MRLQRWQRSPLCPDETCPVGHPALSAGAVLGTSSLMTTWHHSVVGAYQRVGLPTLQPQRVQAMNDGTVSCCHWCASWECSFLVKRSTWNRLFFYEDPELLLPKCAVIERGRNSGTGQLKAPHCPAVGRVDRRCPDDRSCLIARVVAAAVLSSAVAVGCYCRQCR